MSNSGYTEQPLGYTGAAYDPEGSLLYLNARYYAPKVRRFIQRDTVFGAAEQPASLNRYAYALNNPMVYTDPSGHIPSCQGCGPVPPRCAYHPACLFGPNPYLVGQAVESHGPRALVPTGMYTLRLGGVIAVPYNGPDPGLLARVFPARHLAGDWMTGGGMDAFAWVSPWDDVQGYTGSVAALNHRLGLSYQEDLAVRVFQLPSSVPLMSPIVAPFRPFYEATNPMTHTSGGARQFVTPNQMWNWLGTTFIEGVNQCIVPWQP